MNLRPTSTPNLRWESIQAYWACALGRDKHTSSPCVWGPNLNRVQQRGTASQSVTGCTYRVASKSNQHLSLDLMGPNPARAGQVLWWMGATYGTGLARADWFSMARGMLGQPFHCDWLSNGMFIVPDLPPGAYWLRIQEPGKAPLAPLKWVISP